MNAENNPCLVHKFVKVMRTRNIILIQGDWPGQALSNFRDAKGKARP